MYDKISNIFKITGGNSGLTEELIYNNCAKDKELMVKVYSGSTKLNTQMKSINENSIIDKERNKKLKVFQRPINKNS